MPTSLIATYRLQLGQQFTFEQAAARVPYLKMLGISHLYLSPVFEAARGSAHGYDVVDPTRLAESLGGESGFAKLVAAAHGAALGILLDVVPNHMSIADEGNRWWWDVLENGPSGLWGHAFDIDWDPPEQRLKNVVLLPVLGQHFHEVLKARQLKIERDGARFVVRYFDHRFPVAPRSIGTFLQRVARSNDNAQLGFLADAFAELPLPTNVDGESVARRHRDKEVLAGLLADALHRSPTVARAVDDALTELNDTPAQLAVMLQMQNYRLSNWRSAEHDLDYRRFFDVNTLVGLRTEDAEVFAESHALIRTLCQRGDVDGLRVDHVDGLADPAGYLARLRELAPAVTIHVEKILGDGEALPAWPVEGTTGYEFGAQLNALFTVPSAQAQLNAIAGPSPTFSEIATESRQQVLRELLSSDVNRLANVLARLGHTFWEISDYTRHELADAIVALAASFPVYRTYVVETVSEADQAVIAQALSGARVLAPRIDAGLFDFIGDLMLRRRTGPLEAEFVRRLQQLTGPAMAKGVEDTAFYRHTPLLALSEVGGSPEQFHLSVEAFHSSQAIQRWPKRLNALSTHDSKRSADVRARLIAMSQSPAAFATLARFFFERTRPYLTRDMPDPTLRMIALQTVVGAWPLDAVRLKATLEKSAREAKTYTSWLHPNEAYDAAVARFAAAVVSDSVLTAQLDAFVLALLPRARAISLGWVVLQCLCPGVPDFYQGSELWNLSLVDPDNRGQVNWKIRDRAIEDAIVPSIEADEVGLTKMFVMRRALQLRRARPELFEGAYLPLKATSDAVIAFARGSKDGGYAVAVVARTDGWADAQVQLPEGTFDSQLDGQRGVRGAFRLTGAFPVAIFSSQP